MFIYVAFLVAWHITEYKGVLKIEVTVQTTYRNADIWFPKYR